MTRLLTIAITAIALASSAAPAEAKSIPDSDWQGLQATFTLMDTAQAVDGAASFKQELCRRVKRERWTCAITISKPYEGFACSVTALVSSRWWRFPPERFGCPAEWNPGASWLQP